MKAFAYARDPFCLTACALYLANRWFLKPIVGWPFLHDHFNDLWLIPAALPPVLWLQRRLGLRSHDRPPDGAEIAFHLLVWSFLFEGIGPRVMAVTGDPADVAAYAFGAVLAWAFWRRRVANPVPAAEVSPAT